MKMGLVKYQGSAVAPFTMAPKGFENRLWARIRAVIGSPVQQNRWLPAPEAAAYDALPNFTVARYGEQGSQSEPLVSPSQRKKQVPGAKIRPKSVARPLEELVEAVEVLLEVIPESESEPKEPMFLMSSTGMVHRTNCSIAARTTPIETFWTIDDATTHPRFDRLHKCV